MLQISTRLLLLLLFDELLLLNSLQVVEKCIVNLVEVEAQI